ncbi:Hypothetical protein SRAE_2000381400 [Strongyloides ratti]|uniref:Uncharacterized protein n=1 Tax=Strongyloides ratti TaxID=34506 RepID=A0A090LLW9_STRRB|nr:Hypothetical protein SRAE_2000381400 [Strongyloides ratti]CEF69163.1 Hypothetical protein SRAE_2000381400 [Strongyloides ratti]
MFKTASNKPIEVDSSILSAAVLSAKQFDEQIENMAADELFVKDLTTPKRTSDFLVKRPFSEGRLFKNPSNSNVTPLSLRHPRDQSQSVSLKRRSTEDVPFITPKRFMNTNLSSNPFKRPLRKSLEKTAFSTPISNITPNNTPVRECNSKDKKNDAIAGETPLRTINKNLNIDNCDFVKIKNVCKKESKGRDLVGIVWEINVTENSKAHMIIIDDTCHGVNAELVIPSVYIMEFKTRVKGRVIVVKNINVTNSRGKNILKISPDCYRFDGDSFDEEDLREWYTFGNITQDKVKIV